MLVCSISDWRSLIKIALTNEILNTGDSNFCIFTFIQRIDFMYILFINIFGMAYSANEKTSEINTWTEGQNGGGVLWPKSTECCAN